MGKAARLNRERKASRGIVHRECFAVAEDTEMTHIVRRGKDYELGHTRPVSSKLNYLATLYDDGTAEVTVATEQDLVNYPDTGEEE